MGDPRTEKISMKKIIIKKLEDGKTMDKEYVLAYLCLEFGYSKKSVEELLDMMEIVGMIKVENEVISKGES